MQGLEGSLSKTGRHIGAIVDARPLALLNLLPFSNAMQAANGAGGRFYVIIMAN